MSLRVRIFGHDTPDVLLFVSTPAVYSIVSLLIIRSVEATLSHDNVAAVLAGVDSCDLEPICGYEDLRTVSGLIPVFDELSALHRVVFCGEQCS